MATDLAKTLVNIVTYQELSTVKTVLIFLMGTICNMKFIALLILQVASSSVLHSEDGFY